MMRGPVFLVSALSSGGGGGGMSSSFGFAGGVGVSGTLGGGSGAGELALLERLRSITIAPMPTIRRTATTAYFALWLVPGTPAGGLLAGGLISGRAQSEGSLASATPRGEKSIAGLLNVRAVSPYILASLRTNRSAAGG